MTNSVRGEVFTIDLDEKREPPGSDDEILEYDQTEVRLNDLKVIT